MFECKTFTRELESFLKMKGGLLMKILTSLVACDGGAQFHCGFKGQLHCSRPTRG